MPDRFVYRSFQIDTNRINSRGRLQYMNQLEEWHRNGVIHLDMSQVAHGEALSGGDQRRASKAVTYICSMTMASTQLEIEQMRAIEAVLFPEGAADQNERNDVEIVFNSIKYGRTLVTADGDSRTQPGGILGNRAALERLGARVMRDSEAVAHVRQEIARRDADARAVAARTGMPLPTWVGAD
ncbi:MAG TPA: hypothetical protein VF188_04660 [Longimicrobiales bacterium]